MALIFVLLGVGGGVLGGVPLRAQVVDFEDGHIPENWTEPSGSDAAWSVTDTTAGDGTYSLGSGDIGDDETSEIEVTVDVPEDTVITFDYRVSSEANYDFFRFYIDGEQKLEDSGDSGWLSSGEIPVSAGTHTFRWSYEKDFSQSSLSDKAWIDNVAMPPPAPPSQLRAQAARISDVQLDWTGQGEGYIIYRDTAPIDSSAGPSDYTAIDSVDGSTTQYTDPDPSQGTTYYYRVTALDENREETGFSKQVSVTPGHAATATQVGSGIPGTSVYVYGKGFDPTPEDNTVSFVDASGTVTSAPVTEAAPSVLAVEAPSLSPSTQRLVVETGTEEDTVGTAYQVLDTNTGTRTFSDTSLVDGSGGASAWGDYDGDGDLDLVVAGGGSTTLYENDGSGSFNDAGASLYGVDNGAAVAWGDYDEDDELDLVVAGGDTVIVYNNDGSSFVNIEGPFEGISRASAAWGDYDNDGDLDLLVTGRDNASAPKTKLYRNDGEDTFTKVSTNLPDLYGGDIAWGDFNNDGFVDLAVLGTTDGGTPETLIYRNDGNGSFTNVEAGLTDVRSGALSWGDYDNDGELDLIVTGDAGADTPSTILYRNDGDGTFTQVDAGLAEVYNSDVDWGDFDGDGDLDLLLTGETETDTTSFLYRNDGSGSFSEVGTEVVGVTEGSIDWGDADGDGALDLAVTGVDGTNSLSARLYESSAAPPEPPAGLVASLFADRVQIEWEAVGASDLDEYRIYRDTSPIDSLNFDSATPLDTVSVGTTTYTDDNVSAGTEYYYRVTAADADSESGASNEASGTPTFLLTGISPSSGVAGTEVRVSGNGFEESASDNAVSFVDTTGTATSASVTDVQKTVLRVEVPNGVEGPARVAVERSDGSADTTARRFSPIGTDIGDRSFQVANDSSVSPAYGGGVVWGDYNGDGRPDLAIVGEDDVGAAQSNVYRNEGDGTFTEIDAGLTGISDGDVAWGDYNNDGDLDLAVVGRDGSLNEQALIYRNEGDGTFTEIDAGLTGLKFGDVAWGDYNNDGNLDLAVVGEDGDLNKQTLIYRNEGDETFTEIDVGLTGLDNGGVAWGDYNGDGDLDLVVNGLDNDGNAQTIIYRNEGDGTFTEIDAGLTGLSNGDMAWGDYNGDGDLDLAIVGTDNDVNRQTLIYRNEGDGTFTEIDAGLTGISDGDVAWGDYNGDGELDLAVVGQDNDGGAQSKVYRNEGDGTFTHLRTGLAGVGEGSVAWGDYEGDGTLDLFLIGRRPSGVESYEYVASLYESRPEPVAPTTLLAQPEEGGRVRVAWDSSSSGDIQRYRLYRSTDSITASPSELTPYDSVSAGTHQFVDTSVTAKTTYHYRVTALDETGEESAFSPESPATPKPAAGTLYVDKSAAGADTGSSWEDAFPHLTEAVDSVNANPVTDYEIRVAEGAYYPDEDLAGNTDDTTAAFRITVDDVSLLGGYPQGGGSRDPETNVTVLSGDVTQDDSTSGAGVTDSADGIEGANANTVLSLGAFSESGSPEEGEELDPANLEPIGKNTLIDGVTITAGRASATVSGDGQESSVSVGGGVVCQAPGDGTACSPVFRQVRFQGNVASAGGALAVGGFEGGEASPSFRDVVFRNNRSAEWGGAVGIKVGGVDAEGAASPQFTAVTFRGNEASVGGAVAVVAGENGRSEPVFVNVRYRGNTGRSRGGAAFVGGSDGGTVRPTFSNALFFNNESGDEGGAVAHLGETGATVNSAFVNSTFSGNRAEVVGGALYNENSSASVTPHLQNTILWDNEAGAGGDAVANNDASPSFDHSLVEGSGGSSDWDSDLGTDEGGNFDLDPLFVDPNEADLRPQDDSPVLDAGRNGALPSDTTDLDVDGDSTETLPLDLADSTRVADDNVDGTPTVNLGAYEVVGPDLTPLSTPETPAITAFTDSIQVEWEPIADGDLARYRVYRDTVAIDSTGGPGNYTPLDSVNAGTETFVDTSVASEETYHYRVTSVDDSGNESGFSGEVKASPAAALTVWPGDTDNDGVVNQDDVLPLGFQWGQTGPARDSTGCAFEGRAAAAWPVEEATHADANGDGVVDQDDVLCIGLNWSDSTATSKAAPLYAEGEEKREEASTTVDPAPDPSAARSGQGARARRGAPKGSETKSASPPERGRLELEAPSEPDSVLWVNVRADDVDRIGGTAFEVAYSSEHASVEEIEFREWFGEGQFNQSNVDDEAGVVGVGIVTPDTMRSGDGVLARLKVRLKEDVTDPVRLQLQDVRIGRASGTIAALEAGSEVRVRRVPDKFELHGNFPNPVRHETTIRYDLPDERHVKLRVYDVLGRRVATLEDRTREAGKKEVTWRTNNIASGLYLYRLTAGDESETGKMTVVR